jgi:hypothetical protein
MIVDDKRIARAKEVETGERIEGRVRIAAGRKSAINPSTCAIQSAA